MVIRKFLKKMGARAHNMSNTRSKEAELKILPNDVFVVSYPKSGNTWLRFILANLFYEKENVNFTNIHQYCPEVGKLNDFALRTNQPRLIKSHERFNPSFPKVIYMVRDGRDVYISYYYYLKNRLSSGMSLGAFLKEEPKPYGRWCDHIISWLDNYTNKRLLLIKYEDLYLYSINTMRKVVDFLNLEKDDICIKTALEKTTFEKMKKIEKKYGRGKYKTGPDIFMRKGQIGDWRKHFGEDEKSIFKKNEAQVLVRLGYEKDSNW